MGSVSRRRISRSFKHLIMVHIKPNLSSDSDLKSSFIIIYISLSIYLTSKHFSDLRLSKWVRLRYYPEVHNGSAPSWTKKNPDVSGWQLGNDQLFLPWVLAASSSISDKRAQSLLSYNLPLTSPASNGLSSKAKGCPNPRLSGILTLVQHWAVFWQSSTSQALFVVPKVPVLMPNSHCCQDVNIISFAFTRGKELLLHNVDPWGTSLSSP